MIVSDRHQHLLNPTREFATAIFLLFSLYKMKALNMRFFALCLFAVGVVLPNVTATAADDGYVSLFDGKTLHGWDGNPEFWSVRDGAITGQTTKENPTKGNTFLVYRGGEFKNFELKFEYRIVDGNSGVQYRSFEPDAEKQKWVVGGYQADLEAGNTFSGILYG